MGDPIEPDSIAAEYASGRMPSLVFAEWGTPELADAYSLTVTTPHTLFILCQTPPPVGEPRHRAAPPLRVDAAQANRH